MTYIDLPVGEKILRSMLLICHDLMGSSMGVVEDGLPHLHPLVNYPLYSVLYPHLAFTGVHRSDE